MCAHCKCVCISGGVAFVCVIYKKVGQSGWTRAPLCPPIISKLTCCWNLCGLFKAEQHELCYSGRLKYMDPFTLYKRLQCKMTQCNDWKVVHMKLHCISMTVYPSSTLSWRSVCVWAGIPCVRVFFSIILALCSFGIVQRKAKINFILRAWLSR